MDATKILIWIGISIGSVILTLLIILTIMYFKRVRKEKTLCYFITHDKKLEKKKFLNIADTFFYDDVEYNYKHEYAIQEKGVNKIFYNIGKPDPIDIKNPSKGSFTYSDYKAMIKSKVIKDLFVEDKSFFEDSGMLMLILGIAVLIIIIAMWYFQQQAVQIATDQVTKDFIKQAVTEAIKGV